MKKNIFPCSSLKKKKKLGLNWVGFGYPWDQEPGTVAVLEIFLRLAIKKL